MRVFLTGATGFLGGHLAEALVGRGYSVRASVRPTSNSRRIAELGIATVELDLSELANPSSRGKGSSEKLEWLRALSGCEQVVHCAGITRAPDPETFSTTNTVATRRLAELAVEAGVERFVFISSLAARGPDGHELPVSPYGWSKAEAEMSLRLLEEYLDLVILQPGGILGPRDRTLLPLFRMAARGIAAVPAGSQPLQPVHATDVARAVLHSVDKGSGAGPLPIAGAERGTWEEVAQILLAALHPGGRVVRLPAGLVVGAGTLFEFAARLLGRTPPLDRRRAHDLTRHTWTCDLDKSILALGGWRPLMGIEATLVEIAEWYRRTGWL